MSDSPNCFNKCFCTGSNSKQLNVSLHPRDSKLVPSQLSTGTLILQNVQPSDSGTYTCAAVNSITRNEIHMHHRLNLHVTETGRAAPTLLLTGGPATRRFTVRAGAVALLECPGHGNPIPKAVWSRPDASIHKNRTAVLDYGLQIVDIQPGDAGTYVCRLDNGIAPALVHTVQLDVLQAARISVGPLDQQAPEGDDVQMDCQVHGTPQPEVYWTINGMDTRTDEHVVRQLNGTRMTVHQVQKRHAGIVQCFARNEVGEVSEKALLEVIPKQIPGIELYGSEMGGLPVDEDDVNGGALAAVALASKHSAMEHGRNGGGGGGKSKGHTKHKQGEWILLVAYFWDVERTTSKHLYSNDKCIYYKQENVYKLVWDMSIDSCVEM